MKCSFTNYKSTENLFRGITSSNSLNILQKYYFFLTLVLLLFSIPSFSQVGVGTTDPKATLDIRSTSQTTPSNTDGILIPKVDNFPLTNPTISQDGMMVYATGSGTPTKGFYYWDNGSTCWKQVEGMKKIDELSDGKSDSNGSSIFLGIGAGASDISSTNRNLGVGLNALNKNTDGTNNTAAGYETLLNNISGNSNTAIGSQSLKANTKIGPASGSFNTATGSQTLKVNTVGSYNTANGFSALFKNIGGGFNTAIGYLTLYNNTAGNYNTAVGNGALNGLAGGSKNVAIGATAGANLTSGGSNILIGSDAGGTGTSYSNRLYIENSNSDTPLIYGEFDNDLLRFNADVEVNTGSLNVDGGTFFVDEVNNRVGVGTVSPTTKLQIVGGTDAKLFNNTGYIVSGPEDGLNIVIDNNEIMARNNGSTSSLFLQKEGGDVMAGGDVRAMGDVYARGVMLTSDKRLKRDITDLSYGLKEILQLEPKSYYFINSEQKHKSIGLIAQEVQPIIKEIVNTRDDKEKSLSINYIELIPILINAVKEQETKIQELEKQLSQYSALEARLAKLEAQFAGNSESSTSTEEVAKNGD